MEDLHRKLIAAASKGKEGDLKSNHGEFEGNIFSVRLNSKLFKVPWSDTRKVLEEGPIEMIVINNLSVVSASESEDTIKEMEGIAAAIRARKDETLSGDNSEGGRMRIGFD